jgi:hypothetical protein
MNYRLAAAGSIAACVILGTAGGVAAFAGGTPDPTSSTTGTKKPPPGVEASSDLTDVAHDLGVTEQQLLDALPAAKQASVVRGGPSSPDRVAPDVDAAAASLASSLHVAQDAARQAFTKLISNRPKVEQGPPAEAPDARTISSLASYLHTSTAQARHVWDVVSASDNGADPTSPKFAALADSVGLRAAQLHERLRDFKTSFVAEPSSAPKSTQKAP